MKISIPLLLILWVTMGGLLADGPSDNDPDDVRRIPPPGIEVPEKDRREIELELERLADDIGAILDLSGDRPEVLDLLPDVEIFYKSVYYSLEYDEFQRFEEIEIARSLIAQGRARAQQLMEGSAPWLYQTGLVVRGFRSKIDGSAQPYGLVIPETYQFDGEKSHRLDLWFHGRGERSTELSFIHQRQTNPGQFAPPETIVLHPFARYSNGNKFAGEIDCLEALDHVRQLYRVDEDRILVRGFSMGGAACWNLAVHYADRWAGANPGAGFAETAEFLKFFQEETLNPTWYQRKLWHLYDCTDYALNLYHCPTVAYSGELDPQKQAADIMAEAMRKEGMELAHLIGPGAGHEILEALKPEIERRVSGIAAAGREQVPRRIRFTTWTLRYNRMHWLTIDALAEHWVRARAEAEIAGSHRVIIKRLQNVTAFTLSMGPGQCPLDNTRVPIVEIDGQKIEAAPVMSDRSWTAHFRKSGETWELVTSAQPGYLAKRHGLQGPIDDAFMDSFLMVMPTGEPLNEETGRWVTAEMERAMVHWRQQFRGDARQKNDVDVTTDDLGDHHIVLWGDPQSNALMARIADQIPIRWGEGEIICGDSRYDSANHVPILIYPNPLNPDRYIVFNSGFTYREYDYLNNARQVPKLPDWAVIDVRVPPDSRRPGGIAGAGFFGERWELRQGKR